MTLKYEMRLCLAWPPNGDARIGARGDETTVRQQHDGINCAIVKTQHLLGSVPPQRPANDGGIKTAREGSQAVRRDRKRTHGTTVAAQLSLCRRSAQE